MGDDWMAQPDAVEAFVRGDKVCSADLRVIGRIIAATRYKSNAGHTMAAIKVKGTNGALYHGRLATAKNLVKLRRVLR